MTWGCIVGFINNCETNCKYKQTTEYYTKNKNYLFVTLINYTTYRRFFPFDFINLRLLLISAIASPLLYSLLALSWNFYNFPLPKFVNLLTYILSTNTLVPMQIIVVVYCIIFANANSIIKVTHCLCVCT